MSNYATEAQTVLTLFRTGWIAAGRSESRIAWDQVDFEPPEGDWWVRATLQPLAAAQASIGSVGTGVALFRCSGMLVVDVFVPTGTGEHEAYGIADDVCAIFRGVTSGEVRFSAPSVLRVGADGGWFMLQVRVPYERETLY